MSSIPSPPKGPAPIEFKSGCSVFLIVIVMSLSSCGIHVKDQVKTVPTIGYTAGYAGAIESSPVTQFFNTTSCSSEPSKDRVFGAQNFKWKGKDLILVTRGNNFTIYNESPFTAISASSFNVPNVGDSDYDLMNVAVCDDCRYGAAPYKAGIVLFDLGVGPWPQMVDHQYLPGVSIGCEGAFSFKLWSVQYLAAKGLTEACGGSSGIFVFDGLEESDRALVKCVFVPGVNTCVMRGHWVNDYLYMIDKSRRMFIYNNSLDYIKNFPEYAYGYKASSVSVEGNVLLNYGSVWDVTDPVNPVKKSNVCVDCNRSAIKGNKVFFSIKGFKNSESTWDITNMSSPVDLNQEFWDSGNSWNYPSSACANTEDALFMVSTDDLMLMKQTKGWYTDTSTDEWSVDYDIFADGFETGDLSRWSSHVN